MRRQRTQRRTVGGGGDVLRLLDSVPPTQVAYRGRVLRRTFRFWAWWAVLVHALLAALTVAYAVVWWHTGYVGVLFARALVLVRLVLLLRVIAISVRVVRLVGVGRYYKIVRHLWRHPSLAWWWVVGFVDLYTVRVLVPIVNIVHFTVFAVPGHDSALQFAAYLLLDVLFVAEFYVTLHFVYYRGIRQNIRKNLIGWHFFGQSPARGDRRGLSIVRGLFR